MERNFCVGQANELVLNGRVFDLHNCYDFLGIAVASTRAAQLWFTPSPAHTARTEHLVLEVEGLSVLEMTGGVTAGRVRDLDEVGYKNPGDADLEWLVGECGAEREDHLVFRFGPSDHVRVYGERAELREQKDAASDLFARPV